MFLAKKRILLVLGLYLSALGVVLSIISSIGIMPITSISYAVNMRFPVLSLGGWTMVLNLVFISLQVLILRKNFKFKQLSQIIVLVMFGFFIDINTAILTSVQSNTYFVQLIFLLAGTILMALGIGFVLKSDGPMNPGEALVRIISKKSDVPFGSCKMLFDISIMIIAAIFSYLSMDKIVGIREGTIIMAVLTGVLVKFFCNNLSFLNKSKNNGVEYNEISN